MLFFNATASNASLSWLGGHWGWGQAPASGVWLSSHVLFLLQPAAAQDRLVPFDTGVTFGSSGPSTQWFGFKVIDMCDCRHPTR